MIRGSVRMDTVRGLFEADLGRGYVLTCRARAATSEVVVDYDA